MLKEIDQGALSLFRLVWKRVLNHGGERVQWFFDLHSHPHVRIPTTSVPGDYSHALPAWPCQLQT